MLNTRIFLHRIWLIYAFQSVRVRCVRFSLGFGFGFIFNFNAMKCGNAISSL